MVEQRYLTVQWKGHSSEYGKFPLVQIPLRERKEVMAKYYKAGHQVVWSTTGDPRDYSQQIATASGLAPAPARAPPPASAKITSTSHTPTGEIKSYRGVRYYENGKEITYEQKWGRPPSAELISRYEKEQERLKAKETPAEAQQRKRAEQIKKGIITPAPKSEPKVEGVTVPTSILQPRKLTPEEQAGLAGVKPIEDKAQVTVAPPYAPKPYVPPPPPPEPIKVTPTEWERAAGEGVLADIAAEKILAKTQLEGERQKAEAELSMAKMEQTFKSGEIRVDLQTQTLVEVRKKHPNWTFKKTEAGIEYAPKEAPTLKFEEGRNSTWEYLKSVREKSGLREAVGSGIGIIGTGVAIEGAKAYATGLGAGVVIKTAAKIAPKVVKVAEKVAAVGFTGALGYQAVTKPKETLMQLPEIVGFGLGYGSGRGLSVSGLKGLTKTELSKLKTQLKGKELQQFKASVKIMEGLKGQEAIKLQEVSLKGTRIPPEAHAKVLSHIKKEGGIVYGSVGAKTQITATGKSRTPRDVDTILPNEKKSLRELRDIINKETGTKTAKLEKGKVVDVKTGDTLIDVHSKAHFEGRFVGEKMTFVKPTIKGRLPLAVKEKIGYFPKTKEGIKVIPLKEQLLRKGTALPYVKKGRIFKDLPDFTKISKELVRAKEIKAKKKPPFFKEIELYKAKKIRREIEIFEGKTPRAKPKLELPPIMPPTKAGRVRLGFDLAKPRARPKLRARPKARKIIKPRVKPKARGKVYKYPTTPKRRGREIAYPKGRGVSTPIILKPITYPSVTKPKVTPIIRPPTEYPSVTKPTPVIRPPTPYPVTKPTPYPTTKPRVRPKPKPYPTPKPTPYPDFIGDPTVTKIRREEAIFPEPPRKKKKILKPPLPDFDIGFGRRRRPSRPRSRGFRYAPSLSAIERKRIIGKAPPIGKEFSGLGIRRIYEKKRKKKVGFGL